MNLHNIMMLILKYLQIMMKDINVDYRLLIVFNVLVGLLRYNFIFIYVYNFSTNYLFFYTKNLIYNINYIILKNKKQIKYILRKE